MAILSVLAHHVDSRLMPGGFVGVDVFFVISGFLITRILMADDSPPARFLSQFYARRVRRLIPAATVMVCCISVACFFMLLPLDLKDLGASVAAYAAMASNFLFWRWDDYFAGQHKSWPLLHTWSLAVEEQFYLVFPLLILTLRPRQRSSQCAMVGALFLASFTFNVWQTTASPRSAYFLLPSRAWELLAGALCAIAPPLPRLSARARELASWACLGGIAGPCATYSESTTFPGIAAMLPVAATAGLIHLGPCGPSTVHSMLVMPWLVGVGVISYSLYLWHWPLLTLARYPWSAMPGSCPWLIPPAAAVASVCIAWLSYRFVERPARRSTASVRTTFARAAVACAATLAVGVTIHAYRGFPRRLSADAVRYESAKLDFQKRRRETIDLPLHQVKSGPLARIGAESSEKPSFALWGDSHADALVPAFDAAARKAGVAGYVLTRGATLPLVGFSRSSGGRFPFDADFRDAALARLREDRLPCVVLAARWSGALAGDGEFAGEAATSLEDMKRIFSQALQATIDALTARGAHTIWLISEIPGQPFAVPKHLALQSLYGGPSPAGASQASYEQSAETVMSLLASACNERVHLLDISGFFFADGATRLTIDGWPTYTDDNHVSATAAVMLSDVVAPVFRVPFVAASRTGVRR